MYWPLRSQVEADDQRLSRWLDRQGEGGRVGCTCSICLGNVLVGIQLVILASRMVAVKFFQHRTRTSMNSSLGHDEDLVLGKEAVRRVQGSIGFGTSWLDSDWSFNQLHSRSEICAKSAVILRVYE